MDVTSFKNRGLYFIQLIDSKGEILEAKKLVLE